MARTLTRHLLAQMLQLVERPVAVIDACGAGLPLVWANHAFERLTGYSSAELTGTGQHPWLRMPGALGALLPDTEATGAGVAAGTPVTPLQGKRRDGSFAAWQIRAAPLTLSDGRRGYWMLQLDERAHAGTQTDATGLGDLRGRLAAAQRQIRQLSREDPVTGILGREWFEEMFRHQLAGAQRRGRPLALLLFDVESFDAYLQTFGGKAGDSCLRLVAHGIASAMRRTTDLVARVGDRRFAALAEDMSQTDAERHASTIAQAVQRMCIHNPRAADGRFVTVKCQVRVAVPVAEECVADWLDGKAASPREDAARITPIQRALSS